MSFLYCAQPALRTLGRPSSRLFATTAINSKSATEKIKDAVKGVDRTVSDATVSGIEKGQGAAAKAREVAGIKSSEAKAKSQELASDASGKTQELKHEAKAKAYEAEGKAKGVAEEAKGKM